MRKNKLKILPLLFLLVFGIVGIKAQDQPPPPSDTPGFQPPKRPGLLAQLNLSPAQIKQIRELNRQNRPPMREAGERFREASRNLDAAVYRDAPDEADIQLKIKEVTAAHSEVVKLRAQNEFAVRRILTLEQLVKFREIRRQAMSDKDVLPRPRNNNRIDLQNRRLNNQRRQNRSLN